MNRRRFVFSLPLSVPVVAGLAKEPKPRKAIQGGIPQCPVCLRTLEIIAPPRHTLEFKTWARQDTHIATCEGCKLDLVYRKYL